MRLYNGYLQHYSAHSPGKSAQQLNGAIYVTLGLLKYKRTSDINGAICPQPPLAARYILRPWPHWILWLWQLLSIKIYIQIQLPTVLSGKAGHPFCWWCTTLRRSLVEKACRGALIGVEMHLQVMPTECGIRCTTCCMITCNADDCCMWSCNPIHIELQKHKFFSIHRIIRPTQNN